MSTADLLALAPLLALTATALVVLLSIAFFRNHRTIAALSLIGLAISFAMLPAVSSISSIVPRQITPFLIIDHYALFFMGLMFAAAFAVTVLSFGYLEQREEQREEFYLLLLLATLGSAVLAASSHFASFFLGLELLSVSLYSLIAYLRATGQGIEAGIKYLVLAAVAAAFLLFGMALVYAELGTMELGQIVFRTSGQGPQSLLLTAGLGMIVVGIGFKLAVVPFHLWTPDVFQGAPAPVTAFVATVSKGSVVALLVRYFAGINIHAYPSLFLVLTVIALASMFIGNLLALLQNNIKRVLAYSSIAHLGYLLVAFLASGAMGVIAVTYYLVAYFVTTLGAFGAVTVLSGRDGDADRMDDYHGLAFHRPWLAGVFTAMLLSLAGIPLTAGFIGKFYVVTAGVESALWLLIVALVVNSALGLFYYLRIVAAVYRSPEKKEMKKARTAGMKLPLAGSVVLAVLTILLLWLGIYPASLIEVIQKTVARLI